MASRGLAPVVGAVLLLAVAVALAAVLLFVAGDAVEGSEPVRLAISVNASSDSGSKGTVVVRHEAGDRLHVGEVELFIEVDGQPLKYQPEVPSVTIPEGLQKPPGGVFHGWSEDNVWTAGETGKVTLSYGNDPPIEAGSTVKVTIIYEGRPIAEASSVAS